MDLNYEMEYGKYKGKTLRHIMEKDDWYLTVLATHKAFNAKVKKEMSKEDIKLLQAALTKVRKRQEKAWNNLVTMSYFSKQTTKY